LHDAETAAAMALKGRLFALAGSPQLLLAEFEGKTT
jgi:hypothetical protein